jgi:hypothetical protein
MSEKHDALIFSVRLKSGGFESSGELPMPATDAEFQKVIEAWLSIMRTGFQVGAATMAVNLSPEKPHD